MLLRIYNKWSNIAHFKYVIKRQLVLLSLSLSIINVVITMATSYLAGKGTSIVMPKGYRIYDLISLYTSYTFSHKGARLIGN